MFEKLEDYFNRSEVSINIDYNSIVTKPGFGRDLDPLLIVIIHDLLLNPRVFNDKEIKLVSILLKIRKTGAELKIKDFYPIIKDDILSIPFIERDFEIETINNIFNSTGRNKIPLNFEVITNGNLHFKYESLCSYNSPRPGEYYSAYDELEEIPFSFTLHSGSMGDV